MFAPIDLTGKTQRFENKARGGETLLKDRLQGCFLVSSINEQNRALPVQEIPELIAQLVYQRIFLIDRSMPDKHRALRDAISLENLATPDESKKSNPNVKLRSVRFQSFGMKRVVIPEEEIREHFSAQFARQAALQMRYNHWPETGTAYLAERRKVSFKEFVQKEDNRQLWKIGTAQIKLEAGILDDEIKAKRAWKSIQQDWEDVVVHLKRAAWEYPHESKKDVRLDMLQDEFQRRYAETFRGLGVENFYNTKLEDLGKPDRHIAEVRDTLEGWMLQEWEEGRLSATDLETLLDDLVEDLESRLRNIPVIRDKLSEGEAIISEKIAVNRDLWGQTGFFGRTFLSKRENVFEEQSELLRELYERRTLQVDAVEIKAHGSSTAFDETDKNKQVGLLGGYADIGMSSSPVKKEMAAKFEAEQLGNPSSRAQEHVIALDGLAVIVNPSNSIDKLSVEKIRKIFLGEVTDWAQLGGNSGTIKLYSRDEQSGTYDTFKHLVLSGQKLECGKQANLQCFEDSKALASNVASDLNGIGFIGLNYI